MQKTRKLIAMLLAVLMVLSMSTVGMMSAYALPEDAIINDTEGNDASSIDGDIYGLMGDADCNDKINVKDATQIQKSAAKLIELDEKSAALADVDLNGKVNVKDATAIQKWVAKIAVDAPINCLVYIPTAETEPTTVVTEPTTVVTEPTTSSEDEPATEATEDESIPVLIPTVVTEATDATDATDPVVKTITLYFTNTQKWDVVNIHYWGDGATEWPGEAMKFVETNEMGHDIYSCVVPAGITGAVFNCHTETVGGDENQTVNIEEGFADNAGFYPSEQDETTKKWIVGTYKYIPNSNPTNPTTSATESTTTATVANTTAAETTNATDATEATTKATDATEATTTSTEATTATTEATTATTEATTASEETDPTETTTEAETLGAGYYLVGKINGKTLESADTLTADRKFAPNGKDYVLYWETVGGDEYRVAYFDGEKITKLYKEETEDPYKIGETSNKIGFCKIDFNPNGGIGSYGFFTVNVTDERPTTPTASTPATDPTESTTSTTTSSTDLTAGYYLVGKIGGKTLMDASSLTADRKFAANGSDYVLYWTTVGGDEYRVAYFDGEKITKLYKEETEDPYKIGETSNKIGFCKIDFNPNGGIGSYGFFTVNVTTEKPTETTQPTETSKATEPTETSKATEPTETSKATDPTETSKATDPTETSKATDPTETSKPVGLEAGYYLVGKIGGKTLMDASSLTADRKFAVNGSDYVLYWTTVGGDEYRVAEFDGEKIVKYFKAESEDPYTIGETSDKIGYCKIDFNPNGGIGSYGFFTVNVTTEKPTETTQPTETSEATEPTETSTATEPTTPDVETVVITFNAANTTWVSQAGAKVVLVDNDTNKQYPMTGSGNVWTVEVPVTVTNITFNRNDPSTNTPWNSWIAGDRSDAVKYNTIGDGAGSWEGVAGPEWFIRGSFNSWGTANPMKTTDGVTYTCEIALAAGTHEYKVGNVDWTSSYPGSNKTLSVTTAGTYLFTFNANSKTVTAVLK